VFPGFPIGSHTAKEEHLYQEVGSSSKDPSATAILWIHLAAHGTHVTGCVPEIPLCKSESQMPLRPFRPEGGFCPVPTSESKSHWVSAWQWWVACLGPNCQGTQETVSGFFVEEAGFVMLEIP
jgi:hypothetical protein